MLTRADIRASYRETQMTRLSIARTIDERRAAEDELMAIDAGLCVQCGRLPMADYKPNILLCVNCQ